ncbi:MAG: hypothetical protein KKE09_07555 [Bacteroidetes bacterium]|nr:hypothetical protein [Bacteroidota bacterium]
MKMSFLFMLLLLSINFAQEFSVTSVEQLTTLKQGKFYYPIGNNDDSKIMFSSEEYKGLWILDNNNGKINQINDYLSAGYEPNFTNDNKIVYRKDDFRNNLRFLSIYKYDFSKMTESIIAENLRDIAQIKVINGIDINYSRNENLLEIKSNNKLNKAAINNMPVVMIENSDLVLYKNGKRIILNPNGDGNYLWASVSPDGDKLLYTFAEQGTFVTDLNGKIVGNIGYAHYPQWSNSGEWIVYMKDYDDGEKVIDSDLYISSIDGTKELNITNTKNIHEMYPVWSKSKNRIYFNSSDGIIYKIELKLN